MVNLKAVCALFLRVKSSHLKEEMAKAEPPTIDGFQSPFAIIIRWQTEEKWRGKMSGILVFSHNHGGAVLSFLLADQ